MLFNTLDLNSTNGKVCVPVHKIDGICETNKESREAGFLTFVSTGSVDSDGNENGWYVTDEYETVRKMLELALDTSG
jgi:hypothetical protein